VFLSSQAPEFLHCSLSGITTSAGHGLCKFLFQYREVSPSCHPLLHFDRFSDDRVGLSRRLVNLLALLVVLSRGLAIVAILSCVFFGAVSGTGRRIRRPSGRDDPAMVKRGYDKGFSPRWLQRRRRPTSLSSEPCLCSVWVITETSISGLFAAGVLPGLLMGLVMIPPSTISPRREDMEGIAGGRRLKSGRRSRRRSLVSLHRAILGEFTVAFSTLPKLLSLPVSTIHRGCGYLPQSHIENLLRGLRDSAVSSGVVMIVVAFAGLSGGQAPRWE